VRAALARILATGPFQRSAELSRSLRLAVEQAMAGRRGRLEHSQAARLHARLREYYSGVGLHDPLGIDLPEDGHVRVFSRAAVPSDNPAAAKKRARRRWLWLPPALAATLLLAWAGSWWHARAASAGIRSLAVLPFVDLSPRKDGDWFGDGIAEAVIETLARRSGLHVTAPASALAIRDKTRDIAEIGRQLGVAAVIQGSLSRSGGRLRIAVHMIRATDGFLLWSATFDRPARDAVSVQQEIAAAIAARIRMGSATPGSRRPQPPPAAYDAYLEGRSFFNRADPAVLDKAIERLEEATRIDPEFALAWAWLSIVREYRVDQGMARPNQAMPGSRDAAERAVALDPDCGEAHLALGIVKLQYDWDWAGAKQELDRAIQLNPESGFALDWRAHWFETQGRMEEAMTETGRSLALDPLSPVVLDDAAGQYLTVGQPERAIPFAQRAAELYPDDPTARAARAGLRFFAGHFPATAQAPPFVPACIAARQGDPSGARRLLDQAEDLPDDELLPAAAYVQLAAAIDDRDRLFSWIQEAYDERAVQLPYLRLLPDMPRSDPRFAGFLEEMNLPAASK
jgi:TolB-like protein/Tfp pilus assembly protein PilF